MAELQQGMASLIGVFCEHAGSDKKLNKGELRKLLVEGLVIYYTIKLCMKIFFFVRISHINCFLRV